MLGEYGMKAAVGEVCPHEWALVGSWDTIEEGRIELTQCKRCKDIAMESYPGD